MTHDHHHNHKNTSPKFLSTAMDMKTLFQYHPWAYRFHDATVTHDHHNHMKFYDHFEMILIMLMFTVLMIEFGSMPSMPNAMHTPS